MQQDSIVDLDNAAKATGTEPTTAPAKGARPERSLGLTVYVRDVQRALGCSESAAYKHLRRATGKTGRGLLRASVEVWEAYARRFHGTRGGPNLLKRGRPRKPATPSVAVHEAQVDDRLEDIEARLDEVCDMLGELRGAVARCRRNMIPSARRL